MYSQFSSAFRCSRICEFGYQQSEHTRNERLEIAVNDIMCDARNAFEFVEMLSPSHGWFPLVVAPEIGFAYRGHSKGIYKLLPSALRSSSVLSALVPSWKVGNLTIPRPAVGDTHSAQVTREYLCLRQFFDDANSHALPLPDYSQINAFFDDTFPWGLLAFQRGERAWPPDVLLPLMALAQHYELPTRLLDWSDNPYFAAYFAAKSAAARYLKEPDKYLGNHSWAKSPEKFFVIWGLDVASVKIRLAFQSSSKPDLLPHPNAKLRIVRAPAALIPNLAAQKGLFTVYDSGEKLEWDSPTERVSMKCVSEKLFTSPLLSALVCPVREARKVLYLLAYHGVSAATIYPGYKGVVTSIEERGLWEPIPRNTRYCGVLPEIPAVAAPACPAPRPSPESAKPQHDSPNPEDSENPWKI